MNRPNRWLSRLSLAVCIVVGCADDDGPSAVTLTLEVSVPDDTPDDAELYVLGDWQQWRTSDPDARLVRDPDEPKFTGEFTFSVDQPIRFKFCRGDWSSVEANADGISIDFRVFTPTEGDAGRTLAFTVQAWADRTIRRSNGALRTSTRVGRIDLWRPQGWPDRRVWTYLPPNYEAGTDRYPVLYMFDAQNVFDAATSFVGQEWSVDESVQRLIADGDIRPLIVVAVDNGGVERIDEYTPVVDAMRGGGEGAEHLRMFVDVLKAEVDARYRTLTGPEDTALAGSSLGGLMALYGGFERPAVFGHIAALSPSVWWADRWVVGFVEGQPRPSIQVYTDMGGNEGPDAFDQLRALAGALRNQGFVDGVDLMVVEDEVGAHNEVAWRRRFPEALKFFFAP